VPRAPNSTAPKPQSRTHLRRDSTTQCCRVTETASLRRESLGAGVIVRKYCDDVVRGGCAVFEVAMLEWVSNALRSRPHHHHECLRHYLCATMEMLEE
jgi:hypothetical protein